MISLLVRSPADLTSALSQLADAGPCAGRCVITMAAAIGASLGALPPSALPPARKLLAAGYCACVMACGGLIVRIQTGDERQSSFQLLHLPFLASFPRIIRRRLDGLCPAPSPRWPVGVARWRWDSPLLPRLSAEAQRRRVAGFCDHTLVLR